MDVNLGGQRQVYLNENLSPMGKSPSLGRFVTGAPGDEPRSLGPPRIRTWCALTSRLRTRLKAMIQLLVSRMVAVSGSSCYPHKTPPPRVRSLTPLPIIGEQRPLDSVISRDFLPTMFCLQPVTARTFYEN